MVSFTVINCSDVYEDGSHPSYVLTTGVSSFSARDGVWGLVLLILGRSRGSRVATKRKVFTQNLL